MYLGNNPKSLNCVGELVRGHISTKILKIATTKRIYYYENLIFYYINEEI